ncbi:MAG: hypothetical protein CMJ77_10730 [Planctomycetaceae bacterium]|nr:hypothetical protein [Planctomycetaceae bacterium]
MSIISPARNCEEGSGTYESEIGPAIDCPWVFECDRGDIFQQALFREVGFRDVSKAEGFKRVPGKLEDTIRVVDVICTA